MLYYIIISYCIIISLYEGRSISP